MSRQRRILVSGGWQFDFDIFSPPLLIVGGFFLSIVVYCRRWNSDHHRNNRFIYLPLMWVNRDKDKGMMSLFPIIRAREFIEKINFFSEEEENTETIILLLSRFIRETWIVSVPKRKRINGGTLYQFTKRYRREETWSDIFSKRDSITCIHWKLNDDCDEEQRMCGR